MKKRNSLKGEYTLVCSNKEPGNEATNSQCILI